MRSIMPSYYPIFLDLKDKKCIVVGGGSVAERKVEMLLEHRASVTVISPTLSQRLQYLADQGVIQTINRNYQTGDLKGAFLIIAATDDPSINATVAGRGKKQGALVNVVDDPGHSDFIVPSIVRRGDITIAISTSGKSPALARKLRTLLEAVLPAEYASLVTLVSEARQELAQRRSSVDSDVWQRCLDIDILLDMIKKGQLEEARQKLVDDLLAADSRIR
jgi:precorrin-2 dehydrogenase/sirohydrochlorin ferrochelatase